MRENSPQGSNENATNSLQKMMQKLNWNSAASVVTVLSFFVGGVASLVKFWIDKSLLDFWKIPNEFIHVDYKSFLYPFITIMGIAVGFVFISYLVYQIRILSKSRVKKGFLFFGLYLCFFIFFIFLNTLYLYRLTDFIGHILLILREWTKDYSFVFLFAVISLIYTLLIFFCGSQFSKNKIEKSTANKFFSKIAQKISSAAERTIVVFVLLVIFSITFLHSYKVQIDNYKNATTFDIIDNQYVVLYKDTDTFVVKECCIHKNDKDKYNELYINTGEYRLMDAKDVDVQTIHFTREGNDPVFYRLSSEEYAAHLASESPAHETSG